MYRETNSYGINLILKEYAKFPKLLPLPAHFEHGWNVDETPLKSDLLTDKPLLMVFSGREAKSWEKASKTPVTIMGSPFLLYKTVRNIKQKGNARGTVAFPCHSTYDIKSNFQIREYCQKLQKLPEQFHPITICLFWVDYIDPSAEIYRKMGFHVVTAGYKIANSLTFVRNFYKILAQHKYATSNEIGSYTFHAIDLGLPFFLTGEAPVIVNKNGRDINIGKTAQIQKFKIGSYARDLFATGPSQKISQAQARFVSQELGAHDHLLSKEMNELLWHSFRQNHYWLKAFIPYIITSVFRIIVFNTPIIRGLIAIRKKIL